MAKFSSTIYFPFRFFLFLSLVLIVGPGCGGEPVPSSGVEMKTDTKKIGEPSLEQPDYPNWFVRAKALYDRNDYARCIEDCDESISTIVQMEPDPQRELVLANFTELKSDCLSRLGNPETAAAALGDYVNSEHARLLPPERDAAIRLKAGNMLRQAGHYTDALAWYRDLIGKYENVFPERFAKYAREHAQAIESEKVANVEIAIVGSDGNPCEGIDVRLFNGYETVSGKSLANGKCSLPLYDTTPHMYLAVFAWTRNRAPAMVLHRYEGGAVVDVPAITLGPSASHADNAGFIFGCVYRTGTGGKKTRVRGIERLEKGAKIVINPESEDKSEVITDPNGFFCIRTRPGTYRIGPVGLGVRRSLPEGGSICVNFGTAGTLFD
jgi:hypothetical protein